MILRVTFWKKFWIFGLFYCRKTAWNYNLFVQEYYWRQGALYWRAEGTAGQDGGWLSIVCMQEMYRRASGGDRRCNLPPPPPLLSIIWPSGIGGIYSRNASGLMDFIFGIICEEDVFHGILWSLEGHWEVRQGKMSPPLSSFAERSLTVTVMLLNLWILWWIFGLKRNGLNTSLK